MSSSLGLGPELIAYLARVNPPEHPVLARCREETARMANSNMQISAEQGALMAFLATLVGARRAFEVGVFTGYSSLAIALAMRAAHGEGAHLLACDVSVEWTDKARAYWREAGVDDVIELRVAPAADTLDAAIVSDACGTYDFGFIDADKTCYELYYERGLELLRPGGLMLFDNMLWSGAVADPSNTTPDTVALRALAEKIRDDARVHAAMTGVGDGLLMCIKS
jgi:predicted O-methyltransferase YrrM